MNDLLLYFMGGIIVALIIFDVLNRYKISKELKEIRSSITQSNMLSVQNHNAEVTIISDHAKNIIDKIKENGK